MIAIRNSRAVDALAAEIVGVRFTVNRLGKRDCDSVFAHALGPKKQIGVMQPPTRPRGVQSRKLFLMTDDIGKAHWRSS
jgi:hypothetical protein